MNLFHSPSRKQILVNSLWNVFSASVVIFWMNLEKKMADWFRPFFSKSFAKIEQPSLDRNWPSCSTWMARLRSLRARMKAIWFSRWVKIWLTKPRKPLIFVFLTCSFNNFVVERFNSILWRLKRSEWRYAFPNKVTFERSKGFSLKLTNQHSI